MKDTVRYTCLQCDFQRTTKLKVGMLARVFLQLQERLDFFPVVGERER